MRGELERSLARRGAASWRARDASNVVDGRKATRPLIAECVAAMEAEATVETMMETIHAHPTLYEAVGEAFNAVYGMAINA